MLAVGSVHVGGRVAVRDEDLVPVDHPGDVFEQPLVDRLARESWNRHELAAARRFAQPLLDLDAVHRVGGATRLRDGDGRER